MISRFPFRMFHCNFGRTCPVATLVARKSDAVTTDLKDAEEEGGAVAIDTSKVYKIKYSVNILPGIGEHIEIRQHDATALDMY